MTEPAIGVEPEEHQVGAASASSTSRAGHGHASSTGIEAARSTCRSLAAFGEWAGWGFAVLGILRGAVPLVELSAAGPAGPAAWARAGLWAAFAVLAFVLAGWGVTAVVRVMVALIMDYLERANRLSEHLSIRASEGIAVLGRLTENLERHRDSVSSSSASGIDRARSMAEIVRAARAQDWAEAETRLNDFAANFPDDPELSNLTEELVRNRNDLIKTGLDQLDAARTVNDPDRVLEIYQGLVRSLDGDRRTTLDRDLAKWFLSLIHRRLRTGKVQSDVVQLAARFAETFTTTVEGASVRASLPTLRRSVGLCPRCAQPYIGVADACPNCLKGTTKALATLPSSAETDQPE
jgi:hypothetical protein